VHDSDPGLDERLDVAHDRRCGDGHDRRCCRTVFCRDGLVLGEPGREGRRARRRGEGDERRTGLVGDGERGLRRPARDEVPVVELEDGLPECRLGRGVAGGRAGARSELVDDGRLLGVVLAGGGLGRAGLEPGEVVEQGPEHRRLDAEGGVLDVEGEEPDAAVLHRGRGLEHVARWRGEDGVGPAPAAVGEGDRAGHVREGRDRGLAVEGHEAGAHRARVVLDEEPAGELEDGAPQRAPGDRGLLRARAVTGPGGDGGGDEAVDDGRRR